MSKVKIDYGLLASSDTTALHEFEEELRRKIAQDAQQQKEAGKKGKRRRGRR